MLKKVNKLFYINVKCISEVGIFTLSTNTKNNIMKIKFPSGQTANELFHFMGANDEQSLHERLEVTQRLVAKCHAGKICELEKDELEQLIKEVENTLDIKADHVCNDGDWNGLQQHNLGKFLQKIKSL